MGVYGIRHERAIKIGVSEDPWKRLSEIQTGSDLPVSLAFYVEEWSFEHEKQLHKIFKHYQTRKKGEWFSNQQIVISLVSVQAFRVHVENLVNKKKKTLQEYIEHQNFLLEREELNSIYLDNSD